MKHIFQIFGLIWAKGNKLSLTEPTAWKIENAHIHFVAD